jgi:hypothetical protein
MNAMQNFSERESLRPFPPPFIMHALKLLKGAGLSDAKKQKIAALMLKYHKKCLSEEAEFVDGMIEILEKPE